MIVKILVLFPLLFWNFSFGFDTPSSCSYETCEPGNAGHLNIHLVPHTHDDVGWLKTVDQYFYGAYPRTQNAGVQYILHTAIQELLLNSKRRFIYVEIAYFKRWWDEQPDSLKQQVITLVNGGRLEFILGGWCMNDEAATHYNAIIDQMTYGMTFLNDTFGPCARPRVAWQIDPFGHSREQASLFAQMGFDGLFFGRLDYQDKELREKQQRMEEIWRGSTNLQPPNADLFTGVNENGYGPPAGFCFDTNCSDEPIMDDPNLEENNIEDRVQAFVDAANHQAKHFKTNHIMMTMGSDFQYENAVMWYKNLDKLIKYVNAANKNVTVFYSTPSCYLYALNKANKQWSVKTDDFFPYADSPHAFWTGYYTSRPGLKGYVRESNKFLQVCNQLEVLSQFNNKKSKNNQSGATPVTLREAMGVLQHHDAVSGTSKQHVADDYAKRLYIGRKACKAVISEAITGAESQLYFCDYLNISLCNYTQQMSEFLVHVYNPLARSVSKFIRIPIDCPKSASNVSAVDSANAPIVAEVVPVSDATKAVRRSRGTAECELVFSVDLPPLGYEQIRVTKTPAGGGRVTPKKASKRSSDDVVISNEYYRVQFDGNTGLMKAITNLKSSIAMQVSQQLLWYNGSLGNNISSQQSGAYIFRPNGSSPFSCSSDGRAQITTFHNASSLVQEVYQKFSDWAWQVVRLYKGKPHIEVEWTVGPIPIHDKWGKEVITRYDTEIKADQYFYTDANGREVLERKKDYRPTWNLNQSEPVAGNYYPVNSRIYIKDSKYQFTILTDRSQGGSSIKSGSIEVMVHRRLLGEDKRGVGEPLNETGQFGDGLISRGKHFLLLDTVEASASQHRLLAEEIYMDTLIAFQNLTASPNPLAPGSLLLSALPDNVHLLTVSSRTDGGILIRLEHQFEKNEDPTLSQPVTVSLKNLFKNFQPTSVEELLLGANVKKSDVNRLQWQSNEKIKRDVITFERPYEAYASYFPRATRSEFDITLQPMEIRTFLVR